MKQKNYIFKYCKKLDFWDDADLPFGEESAKRILKDRLLKEGYLVKELKAKRVMVAWCVAASARQDSYKERLKLQKQIEKIKTDKIKLFKIKLLK